MDAEYFAEIRAAKKALNGEIGFYKHEQKELNNRLPMDAQDSYSSGYSDAIDHVDQQIDGLNSALKLLAEAERLTTENAKIRTQLDRFVETDFKIGAENATLKKALSDMLFVYRNKDADCPHQFEIEAVRQANALLHQAQEQEGHDA